MDHAFFRQMFDAMRSQVGLVDPQGIIRFVNRAWEDFSVANGMPEGYDSLGIDYLSLCRHACGEASTESTPVYEGLKGVLLAEKDEFFLTYPCHAEDQMRWFQIRVTPVIQGDEIWALVVHENVTELERSRLYQSRLFHMMSHDLKTPLNVFIGFFGFFENADNMPPKEEIMNIMTHYYKASTHMLSIVHNMLGIGQMEYGYLELCREETDFKEVVLEAVDILSPLYSDSTLEMIIDVPPLPCFIDLNKMRQVLINLIGNAIKFTKPPGSITITAKKSGDYFACSIKDTGIGIPPQAIDSVFDIYEQTLEGREHQGGTGLGLSISKKIIELHDGLIGVTSTPGEGATFTFRLPFDNRTETERAEMDSVQLSLQPSQT